MSVKLKSEDIHLVSAQGQHDRALDAVSKLKDSESQKVIGHCVGLALEAVKETPKKQPKFGAILVNIVNEQTGPLDSQLANSIVKSAKKIGESISQYNVVFKTKPCNLFAKEAPEHFEMHYNTVGLKPKTVLDFNPNAAHTIPLNDYLDVRISRTIQKCVAEGMKVELFMGGENEVEHFYHLNGGFRYEAELNTKSSTKYHLFENDQGEQKVVITGIANESKLTHTLLQLKSLRIPDENVEIRGNIDFSLSVLEKKLAAAMNTLVDGKPVALAVVGNRSQMVLEVAERLYPEEMKGPFDTPDAKEKAAVGLLKNNNDYKEQDVSNKIFKISSITIGDEENKRVLLSFRMPNGDLARMATKAVFAQEKVEGFVMVGAGGSLREDSNVGSYQLTTVSSLADHKTIKLDPRHIMELPFSNTEDCKKEATSNVTVISPLVETEEWMELNQKAATSVDVETYYIMDGIQTAVQTSQFATKVFPGLFISDVVGIEALVGKIDIASAWKQLPTVLNESLDAVQVPKATHLK